MSAVRYLILGGGLTGLSAAYHLKTGGCSDWSLIEKSGKVGGLCRSLKYEDGFTFDHSIHILYSSDPYAARLIKELLDGNMLVQERKAWVYSKGTYTPYPWQANTHGLPVDVVKECLLGVIKATYERNDAQTAGNFEQWCYATFGEGLAKHFMIPYNRKQWAIDPRNMTDAWIRDRVMTPSLNEVIDGALRRQEKRFGPNSVFWYPEIGGIEALPNGFLARLDADKIHLDTEVKKILWREKRAVCADGSEWEYGRLISSVPLPHLAECMVPPLRQDLREAVGRLEYNTVYTINLGIGREELSPYHWVYFPEEDYLLHRVSFPKNFAKSMAPDGWSSVMVEVSSSKYRAAPSGENLIKRVMADLKRAKLVVDGDAVRVKSVVRLQPAYVIYTHTHRSDVDSLHQFLKENAIVPCGRFGEWEYLNMDHSIMSGKAAAETA